MLLLITTTATPAPGRRRKRELDPFADLHLENENKVEIACQKILPSLVSYTEMKWE